jgi:hypothetical protein
MQLYYLRGNNDSSVATVTGWFRIQSPIGDKNFLFPKKHPLPPPKIGAHPAAYSIAKFYLTRAKTAGG